MLLFTDLRFSLRNGLRIFAVAGALASALSTIATADITCTATTAISRQSRTDMKHRPASVQNVHLNQSSVEEMLLWPNPSTITKNSNTAIDPRENQTYTLSGDLWRVKVEDNDCDFHLEVSPPGAGIDADRVIVEIPQGPDFTTLRDRLIQALAAAGAGDLRHTKSIDLSQPIRVQVGGYAFFDAFHYSKANPKRGHGHGTQMVGTIWELHPVLELGLGTTAPSTLLAETVTETPAETAVDPQGVFDFAIARSFLENLENGKSIQSTFHLTLGQHSSIHALDSDCEMHVVGTSQSASLGWPGSIVVEPPNLCKFDPQGGEGGDTSTWLSVFDDLSGQNCDVTGFPRIFTEHASGSGGASNPNHVFEVHPALSVSCGAQKISFADFVTVFPGMRAISPSTTASCISDRKLEVRYDKESQQYEFRESGGRCGNFAIVEMRALSPQWIHSITGGHSAIARVSPDGQTTVTLKIYSLSPSAVDTWLGAAKGSPDNSAAGKFLHGLFTYDYYAIEKVVHPRSKPWQLMNEWVSVPFPLAFVVFGQTDTAPWSAE
jgi:hypothetical protein